jgi:glucokinase
MSLVDLSKHVALGIDIGGTNTKFGVVNHRGEVLKKETSEQMPTYCRRIY